MTNPFPDPETIDIKINHEIRNYMDNQLKSTGKIMFYDCMEAFEKSVHDKDIHRATIIAYYITKSLLKSTMPVDGRDFIVSGFIEEINALEENREASLYHSS